MREARSRWASWSRSCADRRVTERDPGSVTSDATGEVVAGASGAHQREAGSERAAPRGAGRGANHVFLEAGSTAKRRRSRCSPDATGWGAPAPPHQRARARSRHVNTCASSLPGVRPRRPSRHRRGSASRPCTARVRVREVVTDLAVARRRTPLTTPPIAEVRKGPPAFTGAGPKTGGSALPGGRSPHPSCVLPSLAPCGTRGRSLHVMQSLTQMLPDCCCAAADLQNRCAPLLRIAARPLRGRLPLWTMRVPACARPSPPPLLRGVNVGAPTRQRGRSRGGVAARAPARAGGGGRPRGGQGARRGGEERYRPGGCPRPART